MRSRSGDGPVGVPGETTRLQLLLVSMRAGAGPGQARQGNTQVCVGWLVGQVRPSLGIHWYAWEPGQGVGSYFTGLDYFTCQIT